MAAVRAEVEATLDEAPAFWAGAAIAFSGVLVSLFLIRGRDLLQEQEAHVGEQALEAAA